MELGADEALKRAGLNRADRNVSGISRKQAKISSKEGQIVWEYYLTNGQRLKNDNRIQGCNALAIPPAWENVWICPDDRGHIQATGVDGKGRLQYLSLIHI